MLFLVLLSALVACVLGVPVNSTRPKIEGRIVGGSRADIRKFSYQVSVLLSGIKICGGAIIARRWVLTAAHCFLKDGNKTEDRYWFSDQLFTVKAGFTNLNKGGNVYQVDTIFKPNEYNISRSRNYRNYDVALVKMKEDFGGNTTCIGLNENKVPVRTEAVIAGWGATKYTNDSTAIKTSDTLRQVNVKIISNKKCRKEIGNYTLVDKNMICTDTTGGKSPCYGDSGGPLVIGLKIVGIASKGIECGTTGFPAVYTKVSVVRRWINKIMNHVMGKVPMKPAVVDAFNCRNRKVKVSIKSVK